MRAVDDFNYIYILETEDGEVRYFASKFGAELAQTQWAETYYRDFNFDKPEKVIDVGLARIRKSILED